MFSIQRAAIHCSWEKKDFFYLSLLSTILSQLQFINMLSLQWAAIQYTVVFVKYVVFLFVVYRRLVQSWELHGSGLWSSSINIWMGLELEPSQTVHAIGLSFVLREFWSYDVQSSICQGLYQKPFRLPPFPSSGLPVVEMTWVSPIYRPSEDKCMTEAPKQHLNIQ